MKIEKAKIKDIKVNPKNPRIIKDDNFKKLVKSIKDFPEMLEIRPIVVDKNMVVLGGNMRLRACQEAGLKEVAIIRADTLTEKQKQEFIIKDNVGFGDWDFDMLANDFDPLDLENWGLDIPGDDEESKDGLTEDDAVPEPPPIPKTKLGDVYQLGNHRLMCGDSTEKDQVAKLMGGGVADMVYSDPPYGIDEKTDRVENVKTFKKQGIAKKGQYKKIEGDDSTVTAINVFKLCEQLCKTIIFWGGNYFADSLPASACWCVWDKRVEEEQRDINSDCELAYVKHPHKKSVRIFRHLWKGMIKASEKNETRCHPTQKPVALAEWCFEEYNKDSKNVLDLFGGSGSTLIACEKTARTAFIMEIEPIYCDVIIKRWEDFTGKKAQLVT